MMKLDNSKPQISGNLNFSPCSGIDTSFNINKLSSEWKIVIGLGLLAVWPLPILSSKKEE